MGARRRLLGARRSLLTRRRLTLGLLRGRVHVAFELSNCLPIGVGRGVECHRHLLDSRDGALDSAERVLRSLVGGR